MSSIIVGSNQHAAYIEVLRNRGSWPPKGDEKAAPLPLSQEVPHRVKAKKYRGRKVDCLLMCCQSGNTTPKPHYFGTPDNFDEEEPPPYTGWTKVGKSGKTICRAPEYLTDDRDDLLE